MIIMAICHDLSLAISFSPSQVTPGAMDLSQQLDVEVLSRTLSWLPQRQALALMLLASDWAQLVATHLKRLATWLGHQTWDGYSTALLVYLIFWGLCCCNFVWSACRECKGQSFGVNPGNP